jgi:nicotinamidase-related amidase
VSTEALLVMDVQNGLVERLPAGGGSLLDLLAETTAAARSAGAPEVSPHNLSFSRLAGTTTMGETDVATQIHPALAPQPGDLVVTKRRISAFAGSDLDVVLRSLGVDALVLAGISTSGVVLSTLRQAADLDFGLTVLRDGCWDPDEEVHRVLLDKVFPRQAAVVSAREWMATLAG